MAPVTTKEKIEKAKKLAEKVEPRSPPLESSKPSTPRKSRPKVLPPPGEAFQGPAPKKARAKKPVTTKEKISAAEIQQKVEARFERQKKADAKAAAAAPAKAARAALRDAEKAKKAALREVEKAEKAEAAKKKKAEGGEVAEKKAKSKAKTYVPSALSMLAMSSRPTAVQFKKKSVLERPTERAKRDRATMMSGVAVIVSGPEVVNKGKGKVEEVKSFRLMDLPEEIRGRIWKLAVVHHPYCIWPVQPKGREQPDLAMSGKAVRAEVLPVYYGLNTFGIDITPLPAIKMSESVKMPEPAKEGECSQKPGKLVVDISKADDTMIDEIKPWIRILEQGGRLSQIQHWIFSYEPKTLTPGRAFPDIDESRTLIVYLNIWHDGEGWRGKVEIHREACCVLPGQSAFQACVIQNSPDFVNRYVDMFLRRAEQKGLVGAVEVAGLAKSLSKKVDELVGCRCENVVQSREGI